MSNWGSQRRPPRLDGKCARCGGDRDTKHSYCKPCRSEYFKAWEAKRRAEQTITQAERAKQRAAKE